MAWAKGPKIINDEITVKSFSEGKLSVLDLVATKCEKMPVFYAIKQH